MDSLNSERSDEFYQVKLTKITYMVWQEVVVHEILESDNDRFFGQVAEGAVRTHNPQMPFIPPTVQWANDVAFVAQAFPDTDDIIKDKLVGKIHYALVVFTRIKYSPTKSVMVGSESIGVRLEKTINPIFLDLADYLNGFKQDERIVLIHGKSATS